MLERRAWSSFFGIKLGSALAVTTTLLICGAAQWAEAFPLTSRQVWGARLSTTYFDKGFPVDGVIALSNCSGSLVRFKTTSDDSLAMILTNGHCSGGMFGGMPKPGQVITDKARKFDVSLLDKAGSELVSLRADKILYATMTDTDVALLQLTKTYSEIRKSSGVEALVVSDQHPVAKTAIQVPSGYWNRTYSCEIDGFVETLKEGNWTFKDSVRYSPKGCDVIGGTSGSPIVSAASGEVIAINNTINEDGEQCTVNNPCEVDATGKITATQGRGYGQETYEINACLNAKGEFDLSVAGCSLPKP